MTQNLAEFNIHSPSDLAVHDLEGARCMLDALVRYLATRPEEAVAAIARLVSTLPVGRQGRVFAHTRGLFDVLAALPGARLLHTPPDGRHRYHLHGVTAIVDGVEFEAMYRREAEPITDAQAAQIHEDEIGAMRA